jgi:hypothetical protein
MRRLGATLNRIKYVTAPIIPGLAFILNGSSGAGTANRGYRIMNSTGRCAWNELSADICPGEGKMNRIVYIIGLIVVVLIVLSFLGLR